MSEKADKRAPEVSVEEYLAGVTDVSNTLKGMFAHHAKVALKKEKASAAYFEARFEEFKKLPASELK